MSLGISISTGPGRPLVATFEAPPERNGWLPERLEKVFPEHGQRLVKQTFDCCSEPEIRAVLKSLDADQIVLAGAETDVCVLQSALGLLELGFEVFLLEDSVFSNESKVAPALERMYQAGVVPCTYKTFFYEMTASVDRESLPESWRDGRQTLDRGPGCQWRAEGKRRESTAAGRLRVAPLAGPSALGALRA